MTALFAFVWGLMFSSLSMRSTDELLDEIESDLRSIAEVFGYTYVRPVLSDESAQVLRRSLTRFMRLYALALKRLERNGVNFVYVEEESVDR